MFFGIDAEKLLLIGIVAVIIVGPQRLPQVARGFARFVAKMKVWSSEAKARIKTEMGDELDDVEWRKLDPRQYDPRRIIRQALLEDIPASAPTPASPVVSAPSVPEVPPPAMGPVGRVATEPLDARPAPPHETDAAETPVERE